MRPSTEDLLAVRDNEPVDAVARAAIEASVAYGREVQGFRRVQEALRSLPPLEPPRDVLRRVLDVRETRAARHGRWLRVAVGAGFAAAVATAAVVYVGVSSSVRSASQPAPVSEEADVRRLAELPAYGALVEQSAQLDRMLAELPTQRPLMTGAAASTIAGLEDRIAFVDEQLAFSAAGRVPVPQRAALWSDRVELMNALVSIRFAEAQGNGF